MNNFEFQTIRDEIAKEKPSSKFKPLTAEEYAYVVDEGRANLKDYFLDLRRNIQDKVGEKEDKERVALLRELISEDAQEEHKKILRTFNQKAKVTKMHPQREFIDINDEETEEKIEAWVERLIRDVRANSREEFSQKDEEDLRAQCWMYFDSVGTVMNTKSIQKEVAEELNDDFDKSPKKEQNKQKKEVVAELQKRFPFKEEELEVLIDLELSKRTEDEQYSAKILIEQITNLWKDYKIGDQKAGVAKVSAGLLVAELMTSFSPSLFEGLIEDDKFRVAVFLEFMGINIGSDLIRAKVKVEIAKLLTEINYQINERIANSLFFQEFEFIHDKSLGEIFAVLERGKVSSARLLQDFITRFAPNLVGLGLSLAFLSKVNPVLGGIGLAGLPVMFHVAKKQNEKLWPMYEEERREGEKIATNLGAIKGGFEEVKASPDVPVVAEEVKAQMDRKDELFLRRYVEEIKMGFIQRLPFDVSTAVATCVGGIMQAMGLISGGAVLSNIIYSQRLNRPVEDIVRLFFNDFSRYLQDIQRMDEILGEYDKLQLPDSDEEKMKKDVAELKTLDIRIRGLKYKKVLNGVNLDIAQGEFVTIAGESGGGKSTLMRNMVGLYQPDAGTIELGETETKDIRKYGEGSIYSVMSYCNQSPQIFEGKTLRENLMLWSREDVGDDEIKQILKDLKLEKFAGKLDEEVKHFSGGERVRIGVARTLIKGAKIMLLDEPTTGLDSRGAKEVREILEEIHQKYPEKTIVCVTHDEKLMQESDRNIEIDKLGS